MEVWTESLLTMIGTHGLSHRPLRVVMVRHSDSSVSIILV